MQWIWPQFCAPYFLPLEYHKPRRGVEQLPVATKPLAAQSGGIEKYFRDLQESEKSFTFL